MGKTVDFLLFGKASAVGVLIAAPVGPIGLLCMQRTLTSGLKVGLMSGLGAASADAVYGAVGAFGLTAVIQLFTAISGPLAIFGALFLAWMGVRLLKTPAGAQAASATSASGALKAFVSAMLLTLANPMTILSFIAVFAGLSSNIEVTPSAAVTMVSGVFVGSTIWWLMLTGSVALLRHKVGNPALAKISQGAGVLLIGFAGWQIQSVLI